MKLFLKFLLPLLAFSILLYVSIVLLVEPWIAAKVETAINDKNKEYLVEIHGVDILFFSPGIELKRITLISKKQNGLTGNIRSIKAKGINLKALWNKDIDIREVCIADGHLSGNLSSPEKNGSVSTPENTPNLSPAAITIGKLTFDKLNLTIADTASALAYSIKEGVAKIFNIHIQKQDTLGVNILRQFDFKAEELQLVSGDSLHTFSAQGISYSDSSAMLEIQKFSIHPNYTNHDFTSRFNYQTDRIEASGNTIAVHDFSIATYLKSLDIISSYIEIEKLDLQVFRDKRKEFKHVLKPTFQEMMYNYPQLLQIDSIGLINGNVTYTEHAEGANEAGYISFNSIHAKIYNITNDTIYKSKNAFTELRSNALLMGKSKIDILLKAKLYEPENTFTVSGSLAAMQASELNPILEKNGFIYVTNGKIDAMNFSFTANNTKSSGVLTMLYHDLDITVKNKRTDDTTALKERFISAIANTLVINSNPMPGHEVRNGKIEHERDAEKFLFNYCVKSILSGIKNTVTNVKSKAEKQARKAERKKEKR
ncbi:MAG: hypothetical protein AB7G44_12220 [Bacteroidia bacterium]